MDIKRGQRAVRRSEAFMLAAYFLSRCTAPGGRPPATLGVGSWKEAFDRFYNACGEGRDLETFRRSFRLTRDEFDAYFPNGRSGFLASDRKSPGRTGGILAAILAAWQDRSDVELFDAIQDMLSDFTSVVELAAAPENLPSPRDVAVTTERVLRKERDTGGKATAEQGWSIRRSAQAKRVGDRAEQIVKEHLLQTLAPAEAETLVHHAAIGETPGYDLSYSASDGLVAVEVKGTIAEAMDGFELTAGELDAARRLGARYHLYLVAKVDAASAALQVLHGLDDRLSLRATRYLIRMRPD